MTYQENPPADVIEVMGHRIKKIGKPDRNGGYERQCVDCDRVGDYQSFSTSILYKGGCPYRPESLSYYKLNTGDYAAPEKDHELHTQEMRARAREVWLEQAARVVNTYQDSSVTMEIDMETWVERDDPTDGIIATFWAREWLFSLRFDRSSATIRCVREARNNATQGTGG